ncbi:MAG: protein kinase [Gemmataceae bacterium]|nr:protein kinase [Gemmataceae bacterium]
MTDKDEELLADLLVRWEELREQGQDVPAIELCQGCPHLTDELARRINALKVTSWLDKPVEVPADDPAAPLSGQHGSRTLAGRYRLDVLIAEGGFAQVWKGYDLELHRAVAVKLPKPSRLDSTEAFMAEARRVARLKHPGIVPVHDVGREDGACFIVSEFVEGGNLGDHIARKPIPPQALQWVAEVAEALQYAHANGVVHRDIKPANILIDHHGRALLADFGIAQSANKTGTFAPSIGTLRYMSPEQLEGKEVDARSDTYSLGVVLHEALTGKLPYSSDDPNTLRREIVAGVGEISTPDLPADARHICRKALHRRPPERYSSAAQMAAELRRVARPKHSSARLWAFVVVLLIVGGGGLLWWNNRQPAPDDPGAAGNVMRKESNDVPNKSPRTAAGWMALGKKDFDQNYFDRAAESYSQVVALDPNNGEAFTMRGKCKVQGGDFAGSIPDFTKAIDLDPKNADLLRLRAYAQGALRRFDLAIADGEAALRLKPADPGPVKDLLARLYSNRAADHARAERYAEAAEEVTQAMKHDPKAAVYYHQRGSCYFNLKQYEKAAADFTVAIEREPTKASHYTHRGMCWQALGDEKKAAADFEMVKKLEPK